MPKISTAKASQEEPVVETEGMDVATPSVAPDIQALLDKIAELEAKVSAASAVAEAADASEPSSNKNIKIMSMFYGTLNLATQPYGAGRIVSFDRYGQIRTVLYSTLVDIVNTNRRFAEEGYFYIMDKDAVYHLGLSEFYSDRIVPKKVLDDILTYDESNISTIVENLTEAQKETLAQDVLNKMFNGKNLDLNKVGILGKYLNVDFNAKLSEMKSFSK